MELNKIQLNPLLLVDLYRNSLFDINDNIAVGRQPREDEISPKEWKYLGEFRKDILLIVRYENVTHLPDESLNFLTSILGACKLSLADVAILNISNSPSATQKTIHEKFKSRVMILFGITPAELEMPIDFPQFQVQPFNNCTFLHTAGLEKLESDKILKSKLWVCLRRIFSLP